MQKINFIAQTVFEILKFKKSYKLAENILAHKLRTRFSPDKQFLQNHIAIYGASLKTQKVMLPPVKMPNILLLVQICLV